MKPEIVLSEAARQRMRKLIRDSGHRAIRLSVRAAGCSGYEYVMDFADAPGESDLIVVDDAELCLYVDADSYHKALKGLRIDFQQDLLSSAFVYHNPNKSGECGCGASFSVA